MRIRRLVGLARIDLVAGPEAGQVRLAVWRLGCWRRHVDFAVGGPWQTRCRIAYPLSGQLSRCGQPTQRDESGGEECRGGATTRTNEARHERRIHHGKWRG